MSTVNADSEQHSDESQRIESLRRGHHVTAQLADYYLSGAFSQSERGAIERHAAGCKRCGELVESERTALKAMVDVALSVLNYSFTVGLRAYPMIPLGCDAHGGDNDDESLNFYRVQAITHLELIAILKKEVAMHPEAPARVRLGVVRVDASLSEWLAALAASARRRGGPTSVRRGEHGGAPSLGQVSDGHTTIDVIREADGGIVLCARTHVVEGDAHIDAVSSSAQGRSSHRDTWEVGGSIFRVTPLLGADRWRVEGLPVADLLHEIEAAGKAGSRVTLLRLCGQGMSLDLATFEYSREAKEGYGLAAKSGGSPARPPDRIGEFRKPHVIVWSDRSAGDVTLELAEPLGSR